MPVPDPFMVIATENPVEFAGTYHLPEAQLDRFLMRLSMGYPTPEEEAEMLRSRLAGEWSEGINPVVTREELLAMQRETAEVIVSTPIRDYIVSIVTATRESSRLTLGASPRASLAIARASQGWAYLHDRSYVIPEDVQAVAPAVLTHRLVVSLDASLHKTAAADVLKECMALVNVPPAADLKA